MTTFNPNNIASNPPINTWENLKGILSSREIIESTTILSDLKTKVTNPDKLKIVEKQLLDFSLLKLKREELASLMNQRAEKESEWKNAKNSLSSAELQKLEQQIDELGAQITKIENERTQLENAIVSVKTEILSIQTGTTNNRSAVDQISRQYATNPNAQGPVNTAASSTSESSIPGAYAVSRSKADMSGGSTSPIESSTPQKSPELSKLENDREEMGREYIRLKQAGAKKSVLEGIESDIATLDAIIKQKNGTISGIEKGSLAGVGVVQPDVADGTKTLGQSPVAAALASLAKTPQQPPVASSVKIPDAIPYTGFSGGSTGPAVGEQQPSSENIAELRRAESMKLTGLISSARNLMLEKQAVIEARAKNGLRSKNDIQELSLLKKNYNDLKFQRMSLYGKEESQEVSVSIDPKTGLETRVYQNMWSKLTEDENILLNNDRLAKNVQEGKLPLRYRAMAKINEIVGWPGQKIAEGLVATGAISPQTAAKLSPWVTRCAIAGVSAASGGLGMLGFVGMVGMSAAVGTVTATALSAADSIAQKMGYRDPNAAEVRQVLTSGEGLTMTAMLQADALEHEKSQGKKQTTRDFVKLPAAYGLGSVLGGWVNEQMPHDRTTVINNCDEQGNPIPPATTTENPPTNTVVEKPSWTQKLFNVVRPDAAVDNSIVYAEEVSTVTTPEVVQTTPNTVQEVIWKQPIQGTVEVPEPAPVATPAATSTPTSGGGGFLGQTLGSFGGSLLGSLLRGDNEVHHHTTTIVEKPVPVVDPVVKPVVTNTTFNTNTGTVGDYTVGTTNTDFNIRGNTNPIDFTANNTVGANTTNQSFNTNVNSVTPVSATNWVEPTVVNNNVATQGTPDFTSGN